jgi:hypothetical protein
MARRDLKLARFDQEIHVDFAQCQQDGRDVKRDHPPPAGCGAA